MKYIKAFILMLVGILSFSLTACNNTNKTETNNTEQNTTKIYNVQTDSMKWSDEYSLLPEWENYEIKGFGVGDRLYVSTEYDELKIGDVITYKKYSDVTDQQIINTSRIVDILSDSSTYVVEDDRTSQQYPYRKGDLAYIFELENMDKISYVSSSIIIGKVTKVKYKNA